MEARATAARLPVVIWTLLLLSVADGVQTLLPFAVPRRPARAADAATTYWVAADGEADWSGCRGAEPLDGPAACSLDTANASAAAGDTVVLRAGTYSGQGIRPNHSGTADDRRIVFTNHDQETVTIRDAPYGILIDKQSYITVDGIDFVSLMRFLRIYGGHHNTISRCDFDTRSPQSGDWVGALIADDYADATPASESSTHNWVHHCTFFRWVYGGYTERRGGLLDIGSWEADPVDESDHNLIEDNVFAYGGHHTLGVYSRHNVIRRNYFHNETNPSNWDYEGYRGAITEGPVGGYNLYEANRFGYAGASGLALRTPHNLLRYNLFYYTGSGGLQVVSSAAGQDHADFNRIYRNTFFHTGHEEPDPGFQGGVYFANWSGQSPVGNVVKGNLFSDNGNGAVTYEGEIEPQVVVDNWDREDVDPAFEDPSAGDPGDPLLPDLRLRAESPCIDRAGFPTTVVGGAGSGTRIRVADARYFVDGWGIPGVDADEIRLADGQRARVTSVDYDGNLITVDRQVAWEAGEGVGPAFEGAAPDYGAHEFAPRLELSAAPGYRSAHLAWRVSARLPATTTWTVSYVGPVGDRESPITGLSESTRAYTLTGLTAGAAYVVTLDTDPPGLRDSAVVVPAGVVIYLPIAGGETGAGFPSVRPGRTRRGTGLGGEGLDRGHCYTLHMAVDRAPEDSLASYRATVRARSERNTRARAARRERALRLARSAAELLTREYGASRVVLFGSLAHGRWFSDSSDIDLAAWGLGPESHLVALARLEDLARGFHVDLVRAEHCPPPLLAVIDAEGVTL